MCHILCISIFEEEGAREQAFHWTEPTALFFMHDTIKLGLGVSMSSVPARPTNKNTNRAVSNQEAIPHLLGFFSYISKSKNVCVYICVDKSIYPLAKPTLNAGHYKSQSIPQCSIYTIQIPWLFSLYSLYSETWSDGQKSARMMYYAHRHIASPPILPSNVRTPHFHQQGC